MANKFQKVCPSCRCFSTRSKNYKYCPLCGAQLNTILEGGKEILNGMATVTNSAICTNIDFSINGSKDRLDSTKPIMPIKDILDELKENGIDIQNIWDCNGPENLEIIFFNKNKGIYDFRIKNINAIENIYAIFKWCSENGSFHNDPKLLDYFKNIKIQADIFNKFSNEDKLQLELLLK